MIRVNPVTAALELFKKGTPWKNDFDTKDVAPCGTAMPHNTPKRVNRVNSSQEYFSVKISSRDDGVQKISPTRILTSPDEVRQFSLHVREGTILALRH